MSDDSHYDEFPVIPTAPMTSSQDRRPVNEVSFPGKTETLCVCYVDMVNSTKTVAGLDTASIAPYYSEFINSMNKIVENFGAKIVKNAGDSVIYYFPQTANKDDLFSFRNVMECSVYMMAAHRHINVALSSRSLPPVNYRISADYGIVEVARSTNPDHEDLFGHTMNRCAKINLHAPQNGTVICDTLYKIVSQLDEYAFDPLGQYQIGNENHTLYSLRSREKRNILNPLDKPSLGRGDLERRKRKSV